MIDLMDTYTQVLNTLDQTTQPLVEQYREHMQCRQGCSGCCVDGFKVRYIEALSILNAFATMPPHTANQVLQQLSSPPTQGLAKCPLLVDGACAVYENRPALCRAFGLVVQLQETLGSCHLNFQEFPADQPLYTLDLKPYYEVLDDLSQHAWEQAPAWTTTDEDNTPPALSLRDYLRQFLTTAAPLS
jgi:Fe-S-cluster containining protein